MRGVTVLLIRKKAWYATGRSAVILKSRISKFPQTQHESKDRNGKRNKEIISTDGRASEGRRQLINNASEADQYQGFGDWQLAQPPATHRLVPSIGICLSSTTLPSGSRR